MSGRLLRLVAARPRSASTTCSPTAPDRYPTTTLDEAEARHPDLVVAPSEPYPFGERHRAELERVAPVELVDGQDLFWWGVRTPAALERLAEQLVSEARRAPPRGGCRRATVFRRAR